MAYFLSLECSSPEGSVALMEIRQKQLACLAFDKWKSLFNGKYMENSHSDKLPLAVEQALQSADKKISALDFLTLGIGPGRWTGVRTAVNVVKSLSFTLKCPVYPVNSLRVSAEELLPQSQPVFVAVNGFKNQVYFVKWQSQNEIEGNVQALPFSEWCIKMRQERQLIKKRELFCISDLEDFYPLPKELKDSFTFTKLYPNALKLADIVFKRQSNMIPKKWNQIQASYLRSPLN